MHKPEFKSKFGVRRHDAAFTSGGTTPEYKQRGVKPPRSISSSRRILKLSSIGILLSVLLALSLLFLHLHGCGGGGSIGKIRLPDSSAATEKIPNATFTLVVLPDTQYYAESYPAIFTSQTQWTVDHKTEKNIVFLLHVGDITDDNTPTQWQRASDSISLLDGVVPYALAGGNHDSPGGDYSRFNKYFPVANYSGLPTFGAVFEEGHLENCWYKFTAGGTDWMIVVLEYNPRDEALTWANQVVTANPARRVIVLTHAYLDATNTRTGIGENIWTKFVKLHRNISFVFNGHYADLAGRLVSDGDNGNKVYQMFSDYQWLTLGGMGLLRIVEFDPDNRKIYVKTWSSSSNFFRTDDGSQFEFDNVDLGPP